MRVTGGTLAGRTVAVPPGIIRPAMDRMRESLFAILGPLDGLRFLDLFAGSGIMAIEAVSRGANEVTLVERDPRKRKVITDNLELVGDRGRLITAPAERFVARCRDEYDIVYLDPPFSYRFKADLIVRIAGRSMVGPGGRLVVHYPTQERLPDTAGALHRVDERRYGGSTVAIFAPG